jgi:hypothetical protein
VVLQSSPGNLQVWVHVSATPLLPTVASSVGKQLARRYGADLASSDWRHLGRLAGFTNQKPQRRNGRGYAPWVKVLYARAGLAREGATLRRQAERSVNGNPQPGANLLPPLPILTALDPDPCLPDPAAARIYADCLRRLGGFTHAFHNLTGASWINGSPRNCSATESPLVRPPPLCARAASVFHATTPTPTTTFAALCSALPGNSKPSLLFPRALLPGPGRLTPLHRPGERAHPAPLCGIFMPKSSPPLARSA